MHVYSLSWNWYRETTANEISFRIPVINTYCDIVSYVYITERFSAIYNTFNQNTICTANTIATFFT